ncbi:hypothetical protein NBRC110019_25650 [Neptunitalea chrysea]|uniref:Uncharacterized protein n=1 Tax=Neptunitalea chrysea TaxID=1647581 RepID=A0A9W6EV88_9FLAO|nr:hypothetical protein NBRC110019_25650 [Neptunitalea chrysea]
MPKEEPKIPYDKAFSPGIIFQDDVFADINLFIGSTIANKKNYIPIAGAIGTRMGFETNFSKDNFTIAPKIGYELSVEIISLRLSALNYFQQEKSEFRVLPEIGLTLGGWADLTYGYGIQINDANLHNVAQHRVALTFNLNKQFTKDVFDYFFKN